eukprot:COSAG01_NODE_19707_length_994_cov_1.510615_1_plen_101_part_01
MDRTQDGNAAAHALACSVCHAHVAQPSLSAHSAQHAAAEAVTLVPPSSACPTPMLATTAPHVGSLRSIQRPIGAHAFRPPNADAQQRAQCTTKQTFTFIYI